MLRVSISRNYKECIIIRNNFRSERSHSLNFFEVSNEVPDEPETSHYIYITIAESYWKGKQMIELLTYRLYPQVYREVRLCVAGVACYSRVSACSQLGFGNRKSRDLRDKFHRNCSLQWGKECTCSQDIPVERLSFRTLGAGSLVRNLFENEKYLHLQNSKDKYQLLLIVNFFLQKFYNSKKLSPLQTCLITKVSNIGTGNCTLNEVDV